MSNSQASKARSAGPKPPSSSTMSTRSTSCLGTSTLGPLTPPQAPGDPLSPMTAPRNICKAKELLTRLGYLTSSTDNGTAGICSGLLTLIAVHPKVTPTICALLISVNLILPEAFGALYVSIKVLSSILDKINTLLLHTDRLTPAPLQGLASLEEKLDQVSQGIQKAAKTWQMVPPCSCARTPLPTNTLSKSQAVPLGLSHPRLAKDRRLKSQGCFFLVEPTLPAIKESLDALDACMLVKKAELAWDTAWELVKNTDAAKDLKLTTKPCMAFKTALRLARGGIRYKLGDRTQATLLSDAQLAIEFEKGFGGASCKGQGTTILLQCTPVDYNPKDPATIPCFEVP